MRKLIIILSAFLLFIHGIAPAQQSQVKYLTLEEVIRLAHENSLQALLAKHRFRNSYWQYRSYKASYLPSVAIQSDLIDMQRAITKNEVFEDGEWVEKYGESQRLNSTMRLEVNQNVPITGGGIFVASELGRLDLLNDEPISFMSTPVSIGFRQPLFGFNSFKWQRQVEPLKYEEAKKQYLSSMEEVNQRAVTYFFDLALEQMNVKKSEFNVANNDTLYQLAKGRFELGMIDQGNLMQMELNLLTSTDDLVKDRLNLEIRKSNLRTFLGFTDNINIELVTSLDVPEFQVDVNQAMQRAQENNPQILSMQRTILEARQNLARTKADSRFNADLMASFGLTQRATDVADVYKEPQQSQRLSVGVTIPVLDWGMRKGQVKMAKSNLDLATVNVQQQMIDFEQQVFLDIMQFNMQSDQLMLAAKTDTISRTRYDITKQKFMIGKVDVLKLNDALAQRDRAIANYMSALRTYWNYYYTVRRTTLWDWEKNQPLLQDFELLIQ